jgi:hypothetical protein
MRSVSNTNIFKSCHITSIRLETEIEFLFCRQNSTYVYEYNKYVSTSYTLVKEMIPRRNIYIYLYIQLIFTFVMMSNKPQASYHSLSRLNNNKSNWNRLYFCYSSTF